MYFMNRLHFPHLDKGLPVAAFMIVGGKEKKKE
jgi:hypothetical protein